MVVASYREIFNVLSFSLTGGIHAWDREEKSSWDLQKKEAWGQIDVITGEDLIGPVDSSFGALVLAVLFSGPWQMVTIPGSYLPLKATSP